MQRYEPEISYGPSDVAYMEKCDDGDYVKFEDAKKFREALIELITSLHEALSNPEEHHDFDMSDDQYLSEKRRRLLNAMKRADELSSS